MSTAVRGFRENTGEERDEDEEEDDDTVSLNQRVSEAE